MAGVPGGAPPGSLPKPLAGFALGCAGLALGGHCVVSGAVDIGAALGVSETLMGLTVVAVGTSLPELVTSVIAAASPRHLAGRLSVGGEPAPEWPSFGYQFARAGAPARPRCCPAAVNRPGARLRCAGGRRPSACAERKSLEPTSGIEPLTC